MTRPRATLAMRTLLHCTVLAGLGLAALSPLAAARADDASATVRLIQLLIEKGVLTRDQAASLLKQAQDDSRPKPRPAKPAPVAAPMPPAAVAETPAPASPPGSIHVTYVPQIVRDQIASEVRQQVMQQAQSDGWAAPNALPEWTKRIHVYGDVRMRDQQNLEDKNNAPLTDFNTINGSAGGFDTTNGGLPPTLDSTQNRNYPQLRARLGVAADINEWTTTDFRLATGNDNSPISTNQTLGASGDFSKYALWLDRANIAIARPAADVSAKFAAAFFAYTNMDGKLSAPCDVIQTNFGCSTDATRTQFVTTGNTMFGIRNITQTGTTTSTPQFFGLASRFDILDLHGQVGYTGFRVPLTLEGEFSKNFGFNRSLVASRSPVNNTNSAGSFVGGDTAYMMQLKIGKDIVTERWDWNATIGYKYLESDAVIDALTDPNFHLGGTNAKGYNVGANLGVGHNLWVDAHFYSATQVAGSPYANDVIQVDLNARF